MNLQYDCVNPKSIEELEYILENNDEIEVSEFIELVGYDNFNNLAELLGYSEDFKIENDEYVFY